jgi:hypothetical protein
MERGKTQSLLAALCLLMGLAFIGCTADGLTKYRLKPESHQLLHVESRENQDAVRF